ncbi:MAG: DeoR/GlpR family DNA-binding transcription regulator [Pseudomonadota bacterium]|nr:DeoR/GlpR family DNA-binding transcription regulator [Pseudomonadota bacterium]
MIEAERHRLIRKLVDERSIVSLIDLVEILGASEATVRRDIGAMAERGEITRIRGGAESVRPRHEVHLVGSPFVLSRSVAAAEKRAIARAAARLIDPGDSLIITGGTTTYAMVEFLPPENLDILTNSIPIVTQLLSTSRNRVTVPGGTIYREQNIVLSPFENDASSHFWAKTLFTGCFGLNRFGIMEADPLIVQSQTRLLARCEQLVVMADSRKLRQRSSIIVAGLARMTALVTDAGASEADLEPFRAAGVKVIRVAVESEDHLADTG